MIVDLSPLASPPDLRSLLVQIAPSWGCAGFGRAQAVAGAADGVVRVWDRDGRHLFDLPNQGGATFVGFSDDGRRIGTVTSTLTRLYTTDVAELEALAAARSTREFTAVERARFADLLAPGR